MKAGKNKIMSNGFSLIELMVVIAVIAILAALAIPSYKNYMLKTKLVSIAPVIQGVLTKAITYASTHGYFPTMEELGYTPDPNLPPNGWNTSDTGTPKIQWIGGHDLDPSQRCGRGANYFFTLDTQQLGVDSNTYADVDCFIYNINGILKSVCLYCYGINSGVSDNRDLIPGWFNENTGTNWDNSNYDIILTPLDNSSSCL